MKDTTTSTIQTTTYYPVSSLKGRFPWNPGSVLMIDCDHAKLKRTKTVRTTMEDIAFVDMELLQGMRLISQQLVVVMA